MAGLEQAGIQLVIASADQFLGTLSAANKALKGFNTTIASVAKSTGTLNAAFSSIKVSGLTKATLESAKASLMVARADRERAKVATEVARAELLLANAALARAKAATEAAKATLLSSKSENELQKAALNSAKALTEPSKAAANSARAMLDAAKTEREFIKATQDTIKATKDSSKASKDASESTKEVSQTQDDASASTKLLGNAFNGLTDYIIRASGGAKGLRGTLLNLSGGLSQIGQGAASANSSFLTVLGILGKVSIVILAVVGVVTLLGKVFQTVGNLIGSAVGAIAKVFGEIGRAAAQAASAVVNAFTRMAEKAAEAAGHLQQLTLRFTNLLGIEYRSADATLTMEKSLKLASNGAQGLLKWITELALATPIGVDEIADTMGLAMALGFTSKQAQLLTESMINFATGAGLGSIVMERIIYNLTQMENQGKVTAMELRDLARGAFLPVFEILKMTAQELGIATAGLDALREAAAEGTVTVEDFFKAFNDWVAKIFPDAGRKMNDTVVALKDNLQDFFKIMIGWKIFGPIVNEVAKSFSNLLNQFTKNELIVRTFEAIGIGLRSLFLAIVEGAKTVWPAVQGLLKALGINLHSTEFLFSKVLEAIAWLTAAVKIFSTWLSGFITKFATPFAEGIKEHVVNPIINLIKGAFNWGVQFIFSLAKGMMSAIVTVFTAVIRAITNFFEAWLSPGSPPKAIPDLEKWGAGAMESYLSGFTQVDPGVFNNISQMFGDMLGGIGGGEAKIQFLADFDPEDVISQFESLGKKAITAFLKGFSQIDFDILDSIQNALKGALDALVSLGDMTSQEAAKMFKGLSKDIIAAIDEFNRTGKVSSDIFAKLSKIGGGFGAQLADLLKKQFDYAAAIKAAEEAQRRLNAAQEAVKTATGNVRRLVKEYNNLLRAGVGKQTLRNKLKEVNAAEDAVDAAREQEKAAQGAVDQANAMLDPLREAVRLQEQLIQQLIELARAEADARKEEEPPGGGGDGKKELPDNKLPEIDFWKEIQDDLQKMFDEMVKKFEEELPGIWSKFGSTLFNYFQSADWENKVAFAKTTWAIFVASLSGWWETAKKDFDEWKKWWTETGWPQLKPELEKAVAILSTGLVVALERTGTALGDIVVAFGEISAATTGGMARGLGIDKGEINKFNTASVVLALLAGFLQSIAFNIVQIAAIPSNFMGGIAQGFKSIANPLGIANFWIGRVIKNWDELKKSFSGPIIPLNILKALWEIISIVGNLFSAIWTSIWMPLQFIIGFIDGFVKSVIGFFQTLSDALVGESIIPEMMQDIWDSITGKLQEVIDWITGGVQSWIDAGTAIVQGIIDGIVAMYEDIKDSLIGEEGIITKAWNALKDWLGIGKEDGEVAETGKSTIQGLIDGITAKLQDFKDSLFGKEGIITKGLEAFKEWLGFGKKGEGNKFWEVGEAIVQGLIDGASSLKDQFVGFLIGLIEELLAKIGIIIDIGSPSGVFKDIGQSMMEGLAAGIQDFGDLPEARMLATVQHTMGPAVAAPQMMGAGERTTNVSFGDTHISSGIDQVAFEARITKAIREAMR